MTPSTPHALRESAAQPVLRKPDVDDGAAIHRLIDACKPLDVNSSYAYLLLAHHFAGTCVVAEDRGEIVGFVSAYRPPQQQDVIFVWQMAVGQAARGQGLAKAMLQELLKRDELAGVHYLETTISPSNGPSQRVFSSLARQLGCNCVQQALFSQRHFGGAQHEAETLFRLGPFSS
jgi:L-2,4-diaminobutyric acid acetyltransferase